MNTKNSKPKKYGIKTEYIAVFFAVIVAILVVCVLILSAKKSREEKKKDTNDSTETKTVVVTNEDPYSSQEADSSYGQSSSEDEQTQAPETTTALPETTTALPETTATPVTKKPQVQTTTPVTTAPPVTVTPPTPIQRPDDITYPLPLTEKVDDSYFADAVFIGDSRTHGMALYGGVKSTYYHATSLSAQAALTKAIVNENGTNITVIEALKRHPELKKIYVSFGVNEYGQNPDLFKSHYSRLIDEIMKVSPHAEIYVQAILPVSPTSHVPQANINRFNEKLLEIAKERKIYYIDVSEPFVLDDAGSRGLTSDVSWDGIHLNTVGVKRLFDYIRTHTAK